MPAAKRSNGYLYRPDKDLMRRIRETADLNDTTVVEFLDLAVQRLLEHLEDRGMPVAK